MHRGEIEGGKKPERTKTGSKGVATAPTGNGEPAKHELPRMSVRQLEVFRMVCREKSFTNAAHELRTSRASVQRICQEFEELLGRPLFTEDSQKNIHPTEFGRCMLAQMGGLSHAMQKLAGCVRSLHEQGRILRLAADGELFQGGLFTSFLSRLQINDVFRPCFLRIETGRFRAALLNAECDVYFGVGLGGCDRLDTVELGEVAWRILKNGKDEGRDVRSADLAAGKWCVLAPSEDTSSDELMERFRGLGADGGRVMTAGAGDPDASFEWVFSPDLGAPAVADTNDIWPRYRFTAALRKHHPYPDLKSRIESAAKN